MGGIQGMFLAQYEVLRKNGHSPSEAFNETVEEATQSLFPLIGKYGMDYMYNACSTTARRGALDWAPKFKEYVNPFAFKTGSLTISSGLTFPSSRLFTTPLGTVLRPDDLSSSTPERPTERTSRRSLTRLTTRKSGGLVRPSVVSG